MVKPKIIAGLNLKGGCGKTSLIMNLGGILHKQNHSPIVIDLDPQKSATRWAMQGEGRLSFPVHNLCLKKGIKNFKSSLEKLCKETNAKTVLIDCPPELDDPALIAALLADLVLIPITPSPLDIWAGENAITTVQEAREERGGKAPKVMLVPTKLIPNTVLAKEIHMTLKELGEPIAPPIYQRVAIVETAIAGTTIDQYAPRSASYKEFHALTKHILKTIK
jgi:chromosome partitioning protein